MTWVEFKNKVDTEIKKQGFDEIVPIERIDMGLSYDADLVIEFYDGSLIVSD